MGSGVIPPNALAMLKGAQGSDLINFLNKTIGNLTVLAAANLQSAKASPTGDDVYTVNNIGASLNAMIIAYIDTLNLGAGDATTHIADVTGNPHAVTKTNVGLANVLNVIQLADQVNALAEIATRGATAQANARNNLNLGDSAVKDTGTNAGDVAAGDHEHAGGSGSIVLYDSGTVTLTQGNYTTPTMHEYTHGLNISNPITPTLLLRTSAAAPWRACVGPEFAASNYYGCFVEYDATKVYVGCFNMDNYQGEDNAYSTTCEARIILQEINV